MTDYHYHNENNPYAAQWLRNLIAAGHLAPGVVDERSIADVRADDLAGFTQCHFFAGIGGWSLAARLAGWPDDRELWTGSCPCQPFSVAGKGDAQADERHLWPEQFRLIRARRPAVWMGEQVAAAVGKHWFDGVLADLESIGYAGRGAVIPACAINAPHRRDRLWIVAEPGAMGDGQRAGLEGHAGHGDGAPRRPNPDRPASATGSGGDVADRDSIARGQGHPLDAGRDCGSDAQPRPRSGGSSWRGAGHVADSDADGFSSSPVSGFHDAEHHAEPRRASAWSNAGWITGHDGKARRTPCAESGIRLLVDGVSPWLAGMRASGKTASRGGALKAFGNAIVPPEAAEVIAAYMEAA